MWVSALVERQSVRTDVEITKYRNTVLCDLAVPSQFSILVPGFSLLPEHGNVCNIFSNCYSKAAAKQLNRKIVRKNQKKLTQKNFP
jgi:hypothetical protein